MDAAAVAFCDLFPDLYLCFCRRHDAADARLTTQQDAVLQHLAMSGPLTVGEMARHLARAQSVVSEIVDAMVARRLLERMQDARDRRRALVWLTDDARAVMAKRREVLDRERVDAAMHALSERDKTTLIDSLRALVHAAGPDAPKRKRR